MDFLVHQSSCYQVKQIGAGGVIGNVIHVFVRLDCILCSWMSQCMSENITLPIVQITVFAKEIIGIS